MGIRGTPTPSGCHPWSAGRGHMGRLEATRARGIDIGISLTSGCESTFLHGSGIQSTAVMDECTLRFRPISVLAGTPRRVLFLSAFRLWTARTLNRRGRRLVQVMVTRLQTMTASSLGATRTGSERRGIYTFWKSGQIMYCHCHIFLKP